jgi:hypothetical protein
MKSSRLLFAVLSAVAIFPLAADAAHIDMADPRRALGREDDIRVDAELNQDSVASGSPISITYQVQNLSKEPVAIADKVCELTYDSDSQTITMSIGTEVPRDGTMPKLVTLAPGEKKTFTVGGVLHVAVSDVRTPFTRSPRFVRIKVNILRGLAAFRSLIDRQAGSATPIALNDEQFERWLENNDTIFLNEIPVQYNAAPRREMTDASRQAGSSGMY